MKINNNIEKRNILFLVTSAVFLLISTGINLLIPLINKTAMDKGIIEKNLDVFFISCLIVLILSILKEAISLSSEKIFLKATKNISLKLHNNIIENIFKKSTNFFSSQNSGYVNSRIGEFWDLLNMISPTMIESVISVFEIIGILFIMTKLSIKLTIFVCIPTPFMFLVVKYLLKRTGNSLENSYEGQAELKSNITESLQGIEDIKYFSLEKRAINNISHASEVYINSQNKALFSMKFTTQSISFISAMFTVAISYFCGKESMLGNLSLGTYISFIFYTQRVYLPIMSWTSVLNTFKQISVIKKRINEILKTGFKTNTYSNQQKYNVNQIDTIEIINANFSYSEEKVIKNFNLKAKKGQFITIKGKNGVGKSTILKLLTGLCTCNDGNIKFNGINLNDINFESIKPLISIVPQTPFLFNSSIKDNIVTGNYDSTRYENSLIFSGLDIELENMLNKNQYKIGENGKCLSGGQKRKIAIARGIYKNFDVLLIDESFSNLDKKTMRIFKQFLINSKKDKRIIIAVEHSDYLDDISDEIIFMDEVNSD